VKPPTPEQRRTEIQQKLAELKRIQEEADSLEEKIERENDERQEARKRHFELTTGPTFWDEYGKIFLMFALGALIWGYLHWVSDGEITQWVFATFRNIWEYEKSHPSISF
jgi:preprotein translocase subunit Sss1